MNLDRRLDPMRPDTTGESVYGSTLAEFNDEYGLPAGWHYIYGLYDPRTGELRYIGKSDKPRDRLTQHLGDDRKNHRCSWIRALKRAGLQPILAILDASPPGPGWESVERAYIAAARGDGHRLTNGSDGGEGAQGLSSETRERMRQAQIGRRHSAETRALMSAAKKGRAHSEEWKRRMREICAGRPLSRECAEANRRRMQKLTDAQVREVRQRVAAGERRALIARDYGVSIGTISNIVIGRTYGHVPNEG